MTVTMTGSGTRFLFEQGDIAERLLLGVHVYTLGGNEWLLGGDRLVLFVSIILIVRVRVKWKNIGKMGNNITLF